MYAFCCVRIPSNLTKGGWDGHPYILSVPGSHLFEFNSPVSASGPSPYIPSPISLMKIVEERRLC